MNIRRSETQWYIIVLVFAFLIIFAVFDISWGECIGDCDGYETYTIEPSYPDVFPGDGIAEPGSFSNPYVVRDESGNLIGSVRPRYEGQENSGGLLEPGNSLNPYEIELHERR